MEVHQLDKVLVGMRQIEEQLDVPPRRQRLVFDERQLEEDETWSDCGVEDCSTIQLTIIIEEDKLEAYRNQKKIEQAALWAAIKENGLFIERQNLDMLFRMGDEYVNILNDPNPDLSGWVLRPEPGNGWQSALIMQAAMRCFDAEQAAQCQGEGGEDAEEAAQCQGGGGEGGEGGEREREGGSRGDGEG